MLMSAKALLDADPKPDRETIREALAGNLCRCTGYHKIVDAVEDAAGRMAGGAAGAAARGAAGPQVGKAGEGS
jgi:carbon-monoxide dehydrogenase small subunit